MDLAASDSKNGLSPGWSGYLFRIRPSVIGSNVAESFKRYGVEGFMPGYSGTPLVKKLGIKSGYRVLLIDAPTDYLESLTPLPEGVEFEKRFSEKTDFIHLFTTRKNQLMESLVRFREKAAPDIILWISWPKKASKVPTEVTEDTIRELCLPLGFVDIKVCAVDEVWSGLKLMIRKDLRGNKKPVSY